MLCIRCQHWELEAARIESPAARAPPLERSRRLLARQQTLPIICAGQPEPLLYLRDVVAVRTAQSVSPAEVKQQQS